MPSKRELPCRLDCGSTTRHGQLQSSALTLVADRRSRIVSSSPVRGASRFCSSPAIARSRAASRTAGGGGKLGWRRRTGWPRSLSWPRAWTGKRRELSPPPSIHSTARHEARKEAKEEGTIAGEYRVAHLHQPDQRRHAQDPRPPPPQLAQDEHRPTPRVQDHTIAGDDVRRTGTRLAQLRSHWWRWCRLVRHGLEPPVPIFPPDPGGKLASGYSVAVP